MDRPSPDPAKILALWQQWEAGDVTPGRAMANLKTACLPELLSALVSAGGAVQHADR